MTVPTPRLRPRSLWLQEGLAGGFEPAPPLEEEVHTDVCIVGGGYTGLWTALRIKESEPALDVAVIEADICGGGASGRNGGFVLTWWSKFITLEKICGTDEALRLTRASAWAVAEIGTFCKAHGIDAHYRLDGWMWAATNRAQLDSWRPTLEALQAAGSEPFREVDAEETAKRTGSPVHLGGVLEASGATVQPALLALGLRRVALEAGIRIFEGSPMTRLERSDSSGERRVRVRTAAGSLVAHRVVLAMNAWAVKFPEIRRDILVVGSDVVSTEPIPERLAEIGWADGLCISDGRLLVHYYRTTNDGRIAFGKGGGVVGFDGRVGGRFEGASPRLRQVERGFRFVYPMLSDVGVTSSWTGPSTGRGTVCPSSGPWRDTPMCSTAWGTRATAWGPRSSVVASWRRWPSAWTTNGPVPDWSATAPGGSRRSPSGTWEHWRFGRRSSERRASRTEGERRARSPGGWCGWRRRGWFRRSAGDTKEPQC